MNEMDERKQKNGAKIRCAFALTFRSERQKRLPIEFRIEMRSIIFDAFDFKKVVSISEFTL